MTETTFKIELMLFTPWPELPDRAISVDRAVETCFSREEGLRVRYSASCSVWVPFRAFGSMTENLFEFLPEVAAEDGPQPAVMTFSDDYDLDFTWFATWTGDEMQVRATWDWLGLPGSEAPEHLPTQFEVSRVDFLKAWHAVLVAIRDRITGVPLDHEDERLELEELIRLIQVATAGRDLDGPGLSG